MVLGLGTRLPELGNEMQGRIAGNLVTNAGWCGHLVDLLLDGILLFHSSPRRPELELSATVKITSKGVFYI